MERINIEKNGNEWIVRFKFDLATKDFVKSLGFWFDGTRKVWYTNDPVVAAKLDPDSPLNAAKQVEASKATDSAVDIPKPKGLEYLPYQKAGIAYAIQRPATLVADEMGLGKTIQAIGVINVDSTIKSVLIVCPATIKLNWKKELEKWLVRPMSIGLVNGEMPDADIVVINFDILKKWYPVLVGRRFDLMIVDECHKVKNPKAQRTQFLLGKWDKEPEKVIKPITAKRRLFLTGTPIVNRPIELWPILQSIDPNGIGRNFMGFAKRYCDAYKGDHGWDFTGASNLPELQMKLRTAFMVRRLKQDVLAELPPKRRQIVVLTASGAAAKAVAAENNLVKYEEVAAGLVSKKIAFEDISRVRHDTAVAKIPYVISFLQDAMEDNEDKIVLMLHHHDIAHAIADAFPGSAIVTGETAVNKRQAEVDRFQSDPKCRLFIGSIQAAGVGITLTAASHVVFAELDWVPGNVSQAEDRCHRIGQTDSVLVQHLVFDGSIDARMAHFIIAKQAVIDAALDKGLRVPTPVSEPVVSTVKPVAENTMSAEQVEAVHTAVKLLAGMCDGAYTLDGAGFNRLDTSFGHSLANQSSLSPKQASAAKKMLAKYHRQIPAELMALVRQ